MTTQILAHTQPLGNTPAPLTFDVAFVEHEGEILFSAEEIGKRLGFKHPADAVNRIFARNQKELCRYSRHVKLTGRDGRPRTARFYTEEGVYLLTMKADTPKAADCRALFASVLRQVREQRLELARQSGYAQGLAEAQSAPAVQVAVKRAYLDGLTEGQGEAEKLKAAPEALVKLPPRKMAVFKTALRYARRGFTGREIAKVTDGNHRQIGHLLSLARKVGLLPPSPFSRGNTPPALPSSGSAGRAVARDSGGRMHT